MMPSIDRRANRYKSGRAFARSLILACLVPGFLACGSAERVNVPLVVPPVGAEIVSVPAEDGLSLAGTLVRDRASTRGVIALHGFSENRTVFDGLLPYLAQRGFNAIAIDLRGQHGSLGATVDEAKATREAYVRRDLAWFDRMVVDVQAVKQFLIEACGCDPRRIAVVGSGLGASLAIRAAAVDREISALVLLSPGWRTLGLDVRPEMAKLRGRPIFSTFATQSPGADEAIEFLYEAWATGLSRREREELSRGWHVRPVDMGYPRGHGGRALREATTLTTEIHTFLAAAIP